ncbi:bifunctional 2-polyprenyl-6-hydroxyphenol methylase/3-demethylubiquinol 3-O-methyltransferase UbiG [Streptomyces sp. 7-21]|uniref:class I SAM-dependent methyltransferase n=1 Tax=Streptomyces sp. 7-21 TaxID=2802283 RepID=UPI00191D9DB0|nr:class I SAM-dependent methyltransferase [Streptomyces sp. 7-21]MBL1066833.1 class I SAM-dependent methyltransferase [Streptomyces sp. 7-21]
MTTATATPAHGPASEPWSADPYARALARGRGPLYLRCSDGRRLPLDVARWCAGPNPADRTVLARCAGAVLDVGCGPGRMVAALARQGRPALGIDTAPAAVARTRGAGGAALLRSVFQDLPREGWWGSVLLLDGNAGIGGDPAALLRRLYQLTAPGGLLLAEAAAGPPDADERLTARLDDGDGPAGPPFPWARTGHQALRAHAERAGWHTAGQWTVQDRPFLALRRPA